MSEVKAKSVFQMMCFELLFESKNRKQYTEMLNQQLKFPVAIVGKDMAVTWMNEGRNDYIRNMLNAANSYVAEQKREGKPQNIKRTRTRKKD